LGMQAKQKCQRIILEAFYKVCEIVLDARGFDREKTTRRRTRRNNRPHPSFNLVLEKKRNVMYVCFHIPPQTQRHTHTHTHRNAIKEWKSNPHRVLYLHIYFEQPSTKKKCLLERYAIEYRPRGSKVDENTSTLLRLVYKKIAVFLRSLISYVRIVPAFDVARRCRSQISYDVSSPEEHDSEETTADKKNPTFDCVVSNTRFTPIVAPFGTLIVSSTYRRNVSEFLKASSSPPPPLDLLDRRQRRRSWTPTQQRDFDDVDDWIVPHRTSIPREKKKILRYSPYGLPPRTPVTTTTIDMQHVPHSAPATARTGFYMLERHMQEKCTRTKLFYEEKEKDDSMKKTTNPIPIISKSLAKPKLVRRISRSADDKEFGKYWNELPKQMRRVKEEEEENITVTPNSRSRVDTDVHILAFGSPTLTSMEDENEKTRRPSVTSSPGSETPPFASTTSKMSITPLRLVGPALEKYPKVVKTSTKKQHEKEIEISSFRRESSSLNTKERGGGGASVCHAR